MASTTSLPTRDPSQIRLWAASQNAMPAEVLPGHVNAESPRLHFFIPGDTAPQPRMRIIEWADFFAAFQIHGLSFVYEIHANGHPGKGFELLQADGHSSNGIFENEHSLYDSDGTFDIG